MSDVSIKVQIAGRTYPLTVSSVEEERIRKAEQLIGESIEIFQKNYAVRDKQDLLAMASLQVITRLNSQAPETEKVIEKIVETVEIPADMSSELLDLESKLNAYLV